MVFGGQEHQQEDCAQRGSLSRALAKDPRAPGIPGGEGQDGRGRGEPGRVSLSGGGVRGRRRAPAGWRRGRASARRPPGMLSGGQGQESADHGADGRDCTSCCSDGRSDAGRQGRTEPCQVRAPWAAGARRDTWCATGHGRVRRDGGGRPACTTLLQHPTRRPPRPSLTISAPPAAVSLPHCGSRASRSGGESGARWAQLAGRRTGRPHRPSCPAPGFGRGHAQRGGAQGRCVCGLWGTVGVSRARSAAAAISVSCCKRAATSAAREWCAAPVADRGGRPGLSRMCSRLTPACEEAADERRLVGERGASRQRRMEFRVMPGDRQQDLLTAGSRRSVRPCGGCACGGRGGREGLVLCGWSS